MQSFIKAPYFTAGFQNSTLFLGFGSIQKAIENQSLHRPLLEILNQFTSPNTWENVNQQLSHLPNYDICSTLVKESNFLISSDVYKKEDRFSRAHLFFNMLGSDPIKTQDSLTSKKIGIIGCGGIGNLVSVNLATAGVNQFILCDEDDIETSNLSRQIMFSEADIGKQKASQLAIAIKKRASYTKIECVKKKILSAEDLSEFNDCDILIVSADKGGVVKHVNQFSIEKNIPYINVGYVNDIAVWGPLVIPGKTGCYACGDLEAGTSEDLYLQDLLSKINQGYQAPSVGPVNMLASSLASLDIVKFLTGMDDIHSLNKRVGLWTHNLQFETQDCSKNQNCKVCS